MSNEQVAATQFPPGTFTPAPKRASLGKILWTQSKIETKLVMRHGEQALLNLIIPLLMLVGLTLFAKPEGGVDQVFPLILAIGVMSAGFTAQSISVGFDRRYGALKRMGASGIPKWAIIGGKIGAVIATVIVQTAIFTAVALSLGWRATPAELLFAGIILLLGAVCFTSLGMLLGGTLSAHVILAVANIVWFVLLGAAFIAVMTADLNPAVEAVLAWIPSVAIASGLIDAFAGSFAWHSVLVLLVWSAIAAFFAVKLFDFQSKRD